MENMLFKYQRLSRSLHGGCAMATRSGYRCTALTRVQMRVKRRESAFSEHPTRVIERERAEESKEVRTACLSLCDASRISIHAFRDRLPLVFGLTCKCVAFSSLSSFASFASE